MKRIHEYKRQLMNAFHIAHMYNTIKANPDSTDFTPRVMMVGGKVGALDQVWMKLELLKMSTHIDKKEKIFKWSMESGSGCVKK